jgi:hypothetical protein
MDPERRRRLDEIGFDFDQERKKRLDEFSFEFTGKGKVNANEEKWNLQFKKLRDYSREHGHCELFWLSIVSPSF